MNISYGKDKKPNLGDQDTPIYNCFRELNLGAGDARDPPAFVYLSDRKIGRLYLLVSRGHKTLEYLGTLWPHVFDQQGAIWEHSEPQGEPFVGWRKYSDPRCPEIDNIKRDGRIESLVFHNNCHMLSGRV